MSGFDGTLARKLDFGDLPTAVTSTAGSGLVAARPAPLTVAARAVDKYRALERRRRAAQIKARHLLEEGNFD